MPRNRRRCPRSRRRKSVASRVSRRTRRASRRARLSMNLSMQSSREVDRVLRTRLRLRSENTVSGSSLSRSRRDFFRLSVAIAFGERDPPSAVSPSLGFMARTRQRRVGGVLLASAATRRVKYLAYATSDSTSPVRRRVRMRSPLRTWAASVSALPSSARVVML